MKNSKIIFACTIAMSCILKANIATATAVTQPCQLCGSEGCAFYSVSDKTCCTLCNGSSGGGGTGGGGTGGGSTGVCESLSCSEGQYFSSIRPCNCSSCPSQNGATGTSKNNDNDKPWHPTITKCYIAANTQMTDETGTYVFTSDCYYSN